MTLIEWADRVWNPTRGCRRISPGCGDGTGGGCYAERAAASVNRQFKAQGKPEPYHGLVELRGGRPRWTGEARLVPEVLAKPLSWRQDPGRVFVDSMSDLFYEGFNDEQIAAVFGVMAASRGTFLVLTKRAERAAAWFRRRAGDPAGPAAGCRIAARHQLLMAGLKVAAAKLDASTRPDVWPLPNVWIGVSVEDQQRADERIPHLLQIPAAVRFLSCEPLLGTIDLRYAVFNGADSLESLEGLHWVIAGCESGPGARPAQPGWYRHLRDQCAAAGVAYFVKQAVGADGISDLPEVQMGPPGRLLSLPYLDGVRHAEFPR